jgi:bifunctional oligoribonuclease and PAP phosphatase NrnA
VTRPAVQLPDERWAAAIRLLGDAPDALLVCHVAPDGDALGSMLALARVLRANGTTVTCTWGDALWTVPAPYTWLPDLDTVVSPTSVPTAPSLLVVLDTSSRDRLGVLADLPEQSGGVIVVDHHAHSGENAATRLPGVHLVDASSAATAVIVDELLRRMSVDLDATTATLLYVGLVTDTGSFQHSVTTAAVHGVAARLLAAGVQPDVVAQRLWGTKPFALQHVLGAALSRAELDPDVAARLGMVWTVVAQEDLRRAGLALDDVESVIDVIRSAREADVAVVLKEDVDGSFRVSTRSRGGTDVGAACVALGGGGHRLAAGFTSYDDIQTTMEKLRASLDQTAQK